MPQPDSNDVRHIFACPAEPEMRPVLALGGRSPTGFVTAIATDEDGHVLVPLLEERLKLVEGRLTELANAMRELIRMRGRTDD